MIHMKNIHQYTPEVPFLGDVYYFKDDDNMDWYLMKEFWSPDKVKVAYEPGGAIQAVLWDQTSLNPEGLSVIELDPEDVPASCVHPYAGWVYIDGIVGKLNSQYEVEARDRRNAFLKSTDVMLGPDYTIHDRPLTPEQFNEILRIRREMKVWPKTSGWPFNPFPQIPDWLMQEVEQHGFEEEE